MKKKSGSILVVGAGISGLRSALDLAEQGYQVTLIDKAPNLGGTLLQLDYQFPDDRCGMCKMLPLVERDASSEYCLRKGLFHENIDIRLSTELLALEGESGRFQATIRHRSGRVDPNRCIGCGECARVCPVEVADAFNIGLTRRKAIYLPAPYAIPNHYVVDSDNCNLCLKCLEVCPTGAIDLDPGLRKDFDILIVDPDPKVGERIRAWLEPAGFPTGQVASGAEALKMFSEGVQCRLVLLDMGLHDIPADAVRKRIREMRPWFPVVFMGRADRAEQIKSLLGIEDYEYLVKPLEKQAVTGLLNKRYLRIEARGESVIEVGAVILAAGFEAFHPSIQNDRYGYGVLPNVVTSLEFERLVSATGPGQGRLTRPGDGREVRKIAWIQCVGSRDLQVSSDYCSSVCCMFSIKEAMLAKEFGGLDLETVIFYMDMRLFGKDYQRYRDRAENDYGVRFERSRVHTVEAGGQDGALKIGYVGDDGQRREEVFDLVVLAVGQRPSRGTRRLAEVTGVETNPAGFCLTEDLSLSRTTKEGIMVAGTFPGFRDISESVIQASAASLAASRLIHARGGGLSEESGVPEESQADIQEYPRVLVALCNCDRALQAKVNVEAISAALRQINSVCRVQAIDRVCTQQGWDTLEEVLQETGANRLVIGACMPYVYIKKLRELGEKIGLNPALMDVVDIHTPIFPGRQADREKQSRDITASMAMGVGRIRSRDPFAASRVSIVQEGLVVGGGIAGMTAALALANHGFQATLVERAGELGGNLRALYLPFDGHSPEELLQQTISKIEKHPSIRVLLNTKVVRSQGQAGCFSTVIEKEDGQKETLEHGVTLLAAGGREGKTDQYAHGRSEFVMTQYELERKLHDGAIDPANLKAVALIQCVGSREEPRNYCSRVCCASALKIALHLKDRNPGLKVYILYRDMMAYGFLEAQYTQARRLGVIFIHYEKDRKPKVRLKNKRPVVTAYDPILARDLIVPADLLVLSTGIEPGDNRELSEQFGVELNRDGFFQEADYKWRPVDFIREGVFMCGLAHSPRSIAESMATAEAAAQRALRILNGKWLAGGGATAEVRHSLCSLCELCVVSCPYGARRLDAEEEKIVVDALMCQGCGACVSVCPNSASILPGFRDRQMFEMIDAALEF